MSDNLVDVLIPVYNGMPYLPAALESIQTQTLRDIRLIVVNDGSTDDTGRVLKEIARRDTRVIVLNQANRGIVAALNNGLELCTAEFIARHDADDIAYPERLADQVRALRDSPLVLAVGGQAYHIGPDGQRLGTFTNFLDPMRARPAGVPAVEPYLLHPFLMMRSAVIKRLGGYRYVVNAEDSDLYWRIKDIGELMNLGQIQGEYRMHPESISSRRIENGRIISVGSQLAAVSAVRRLAGEPDLVFTEAAAKVLRAAAGVSLEEACSASDLQLNAQERAHLRTAASAKLLELADYRPYELEPSDCSFIGNHLARAGAAVDPASRAFVRRCLSGTAARLTANGRGRDAVKLLRPSLLVPYLLRLSMRLLLPKTLHVRLKRIFKQHVYERVT